MARTGKRYPKSAGRVCCSGQGPDINHTSSRTNPNAVNGETAVTRLFSICLCAMFACTAAIVSAQTTRPPAALSKCHVSEKRASRSSDSTPFKLEWDFTNKSEKVETEVDVTLYIA